MYNTLLWQDDLSKHKRELVEEILKGKQYANQLKELLQKSIHGDNEGLPSAKKLAQNVLRSFGESLAKLRHCRRPSDFHLTDDESHEVNFQDLLENKKRLSGIKNRKIGRGCCKRKKLAATGMIVRPTIEDDYSWRKYGQKAIINSRHPRCYFRCRHKYNHGCKATKQVQKLDGEEAMYQTTYFGLHACEDHPKTPQISQEIINFRENNPCKTFHQGHPSNENIVPDNFTNTIDSDIMKDPLCSEEFVSKMEYFYYSQGVPSRLYASNSSDASISLEGLDIINFSEFSDFTFQDFEFLE